MGRRKSNKAISCRDRVHMCRERKKIRIRENERITELLQQAEENRIQLAQRQSKDATPFEDNLRRWSCDNRISKRAVDGLLHLLNAAGFRSLPKNHRTFLKTPINHEIREIAGGKLWYHGLAKCLQKKFAMLDRNIVIQLNFNIDGLPIFKSSKLCFYPILATIHGEDFHNNLWISFK